MNKLQLKLFVSVLTSPKPLGGTVISAFNIHLALFGHVLCREHVPWMLYGQSPYDDLSCSSISANENFRISHMKEDEIGILRKKSSIAPNIWCNHYFPCIFFQAWYFHQWVHYYVGRHNFIRRNRVCNVRCLKVSYTKINNYGITYIKLHWSELEQYLLLPLLSLIAKRHSVDFYNPCNRLNCECWSVLIAQRQDWLVWNVPATLGEIRLADWRFNTACVSC